MIVRLLKAMYDSVEEACALLMQGILGTSFPRDRDKQTFDDYIGQIVEEKVQELQTKTN